MAYSTLDTAMIIDIESGRTFKFQFIPDSITDSKTAVFRDYEILGRSAPLKGYSHSPSRRLDFAGVALFANPTADGPPMPPGLIKAQVDLLLSLPYPDYAGGIKPPHKCLVLIGGNIQMIGVCVAASATYKKGIPWDKGPGLTHGIELAMSFEEVKDIPIDTYARSGGAF